MLNKTCYIDQSDLWFAWSWLIVGFAYWKAS